VEQVRLSRGVGVVNRNDIARARVNTGLTYSTEQQPVFMRERTLDEVVNAVMAVIESGSNE
jgi:hypothetical protein